MARRKTFAKGDHVEIQRDVGSPWELAIYDRLRGTGRHCVDLPSNAPSRWADILGVPHEFRWVIVPSVRIRMRTFKAQA